MGRGVGKGKEGKGIEAEKGGVQRRTERREEHLERGRRGLGEKKGVESTSPFLVSCVSV